MAITTLNGVISNLQQVQQISKGSSPTPVAGTPTSLWGIGGQPAAGSFNTGIAGATYVAPVTGQIPHVDPPGGSNAYLARIQTAWNAGSGTILLCDRLWDGRPAINDVTNQTVNSVAWPARDVAGSTNGDGILIGIEVAATVSATAAVLSSYTYTNQSGTASHTGLFLDTPTTSTAANRFFRLTLQTGDTGVRSIQNIQFSTAWTSGSINMVAYRVLAALESPVLGFSSAVDAITAGFPQIFNGTVPFLIYVPSGATIALVAGHYLETAG